MNERIKLFEKQCWDYQSNCLDAEKFAELIVLECAKLVEDNIDPENAWITPAHIKEYFGVKE